MKDIVRRLAKLEGVEARRGAAEAPTPGPDPAALAALTRLLSTHPTNWPVAAWDGMQTAIADLPCIRWSVP